jgi:hypothetical protein
MPEKLFVPGALVKEFFLSPWMRLVRLREVILEKESELELVTSWIVSPVPVLAGLTDSWIVLGGLGHQQRPEVLQLPLQIPHNLKGLPPLRHQ